MTDENFQKHYGVGEDGSLMEVHDPGSTGREIDKLYVIVAVDDDGEGIISYESPIGHMPMVSSSREIIDRLTEVARPMVGVSGHTLRVLEFETRNLITEITPDV